MDIEQTWWDTFGNSCGIEFERARPDYHTLDRQTQRYGALMKLELDMYNGGFLQFFCNWGHAAYLLALEGLDHIKAPRAGDILRQAYAILEKHEDDDRLTQLWDLAAVLTEAESHELSRLDELYWKDEDGIMERMLVSHQNDAGEG